VSIERQDWGEQKQKRREEGVLALVEHRHAQEREEWSLARGEHQHAQERGEWGLAHGEHWKQHK
jgi:hypothetical protein